MYLNLTQWPIHKRAFEVYKERERERENGCPNFCTFFCTDITPDRWQSKTLILSTNVDQISLETAFSIAICRQMAIEKTVSSDV